jgi:predicted PhzF superfamily epimerase YddE/YHI9
VVLERLEPARASVTFQSASGPLPVRRDGDGYLMDFPARAAEPTAPPEGLARALGAEPVEVFQNVFNYMAVFDHARQVRELAPDQGLLLGLDRSGVIVTAPGEDGFDVVSRYFAPRKGIPEDPVTGGAHCMLTPYWAGRLGKRDLRCWQASARGGELGCRLTGDRVELKGACVFYLEGWAEI